MLTNSALDIFHKAHPSTPSANDDSLDSVRAVVGWTVATVFAFWAPLVALIYVFLV